MGEETGSLAEIGPRMVLNPIKVFDGSFCGQTLWENADYVTPCAKRSMLKRLQAGKYQQRLASKAAYEASRPTEPTYKVDETEDVFNTIEKEEEKENKNTENAPRKKFTKKKKTKAKS